MAQSTERMEKLSMMLQKQPTDTFLLYAIAMEFRKMGESASAIEYLDRVIALDKGYCYAYHQKGQVLEQVGDVEGARQAYLAGVTAAEKKGDAHAREEIAAALEMLA